MMRRRVLLGAGIVLTLVLGLLAAGLQDFEFRSGRIEPAEAAWGEPGYTGGVPMPDLPQLWAPLAAFVIILTVIGAIASRKGRREILLRLLTMVAMAGVVAIVFALTRPPAEEAIPGDPPAAERLETPATGTAPVEAPPAVGTAPSWAPYVLTAVLALGAGALVIYIARRRGMYTQRAPTEDLNDAVNEGLAALRRGAPVTEVVQRCWVQMSTILSAKAAVANAPDLTAREFARVLKARGYRDESVDRLTHLFEEVRYGRKASETRRDEAVAALSAIQKQFGSP